MLLLSIVNGGVVPLAPNMKLKQTNQAVSRVRSRPLDAATAARVCVGCLARCCVPDVVLR